jgi:hypothetical protein
LPQVTPENIEQLKQRWSELDTLGLGFINVAEVSCAAAIFSRWQPASSRVESLKGMTGLRLLLVA